jgi:hypothetical protein
MEQHGRARLRGLEGGFAAGESSANDMNGGQILF